MKWLFPSLVCWLLVAGEALAQKVEIDFEVFMGDERIGTLSAVQERQGKRSTMEVRSKTETTILSISLHMESETSVTKENNILIQGVAYRRTSRGPGDIHSSVKRIGSKHYQHERNGEIKKIDGKEIALCEVDLYFAEPKGLTTIFSNMYGEYVALKQVSPETYQLVTPDNNDSYYTYLNGKLVTVEADTPLGKIVSKRKGS